MRLVIALLVVAFLAGRVAQVQGAKQEIVAEAREEAELLARLPF